MERVLKPFQERGPQIAMERGGSLCFFVDMGLGKTPMASKLASLLKARRILVTCRENGIKVWTKDGKAWLEQFTEEKVHVHQMDEEPFWRERVWNTLTPLSEIHMFVVVYNTLARDLAIKTKIYGKKRTAAKLKASTTPPLLPIIKPNVKFDLMICDEVKRINNRATSGFLALNSLRRGGPKRLVRNIVMLTGTPGDEGPPSFWAYLHLIDPIKFGSYWDFVEYFCEVDVNYWGGKEIIQQRPQRKEEWDKLLNQYAYIVRDKDVEDERPPLSRFPVYAEMEDDQRKMYNDIKKDMISLSTTDDSVIIAQNPMVQMLRLRQILICPQILNPSASVGGFAIRFCDMLEEGNADDRHTVIFTPFTAAFDPLTTYLHSRGHKSVFHLLGGISANQQEERIENYRRTKGIIICSIAYAEAFSLEPARKAWFFGFDYSPDPNRQAEKRLLRMTTKHPITCNFFSFGSPTEERMYEIVNVKQEKINFSMPSNLREIIQGL